MTWTYITAGGILSAKDEVRLLIGDTDTTDQQLQDEEIAFLLTDEGGTYRAAAAAAEAIAARYARKADYSLGRNALTESASQKQQHYLDLAKRLRQKAARRTVTPLAGGISVSQMESAEQNLDRVEPAFTRDMEQEPGTGLFEEDNDERVVPF